MYVLSFSVKYFDVIDQFDCKHLHQKLNYKELNNSLWGPAYTLCSLSTTKWLMCENGMNPGVPLRSKSNSKPHPENNTLVPFRALLQNI